MKITSCQNCGSNALGLILSLGHLPPVNAVRRIGSRGDAERRYPAELLECPDCALVQIGYRVDPAELFPPSYPYSSRVTEILRSNFADLADEVMGEVQATNPGQRPRVVDIGSNDGTLLRAFGDRADVVGIEPTDQAVFAHANGVPTYQQFFGPTVVNEVLRDVGQVDVVTAANVFAHMPLGGLMEQVDRLLKPGGVFVTESHYWPSLVETLQFDTIYHEHLRYYSVRSLERVLARGGFMVCRTKRIPTHGGSIRVYARRIADVHAGRHGSLEALPHEPPVDLRHFADRVRTAAATITRETFALAQWHFVAAVGAPSRAATLVNYCGLDARCLRAVAELPGSNKIGNYMPGTEVPILAESEVLRMRPSYLLLLSWHIADELIPKLRARGYDGAFIIPLPTWQVVR